MALLRGAFLSAPDTPGPGSQVAQRSDTRGGGCVSLFLKAEYLLNVRQARHDLLLVPQRAADGRWTVDAWGATDGFTVNGGVRLRFGGGH